MSNEYIDLCRVYVGPRFRSSFANAPWPSAFLDFDGEVAGTSTQCAVWVTTDPAGSRATGGARQFRVSGPTVSIQAFDAYGNNGGSTASYEDRRNFARAQAVTGLLQQLVASAQAPVTATVSTTTGNAVSPIVVTTSAPHGYANGATVEVSAVGGNTAANGVWTIKVLSPTTFSLTGSTGNGSYTSGGVASFTPGYVYPRDFGLV
jgi:hypothetical protein